MVKITDIIKPFSKGFSAVSTKALLEELNKRYISEIEPKMNIYSFKQGNDYFIYAQIPSKANDKYTGSPIFYDVVIQLIPPNPTWLKASSVRDYDIRVFSNMPSFMFTFTFAFNIRKALVKFPEIKYSTKALKIKPKVRNPYLLLGIDESLYFTVMYLDKHQLFYRDNLERLCGMSEFDWKRLLKEVSGQQEKLQEVNLRKAKYKNTPKSKQEKEKEAEKKAFLEGTVEENQTKNKTKSPEILESKLLQTSLFQDLSSRLNKTTLKTSNLKNTSLKSSILSKKNSNLYKHSLRSKLGLFSKVK